MQTSRRRFIGTGALALSLGTIATRTDPSLAQSPVCLVDPATATQRATEQTTEVIGGGIPAALSGYALTVFRFTLPPGDRVPAHRHPGATNLAIESGQMTFHLYEGRATLRLANGQLRSIDGEDEVTLESGDGIFYDADAVHEATVPGSEPVVVLSVTLLDESQPNPIPMDIGQ